MNAFAAAAAIAATGDVAELPAVVSQVVGVERCALYLRDADGRFTGRAAHPANQAVAGGPADAFTREVVETRAPVQARAVLGVPVVHGDEVVGLLLLGDGDAAHPYAPEQIEAAAAAGRLAGEALARLEQLERLRRQLDTATRQNRLLRGVSIADGRFTRVVLDGGGLGGVVEVLAELTGKPAAFHDTRGHRVAAVGREVEPGLLEREELHTAIAGSATAIGPRLDAGIRHRHLVAPVDLGDRRCGWVVVIEHPSRLTAFDELALRRAAKHLALELAAARRAASAAWDARSLLARQLIRGTQEEDVRRGAEYLGVELDLPRVVGFVTAGSPIDAERLAGAIDRRIAGEVLATKGPEGVAILIDLPAGEPPLAAVRGLKAVVAEACGELGLEATGGLSAICRAAADVPRAYREAREVARCIERFSARRILAADDLGPVRVFVANGDAPGMDRFVEDALGPLLTGGPGMAELLRTLQSLFDCGRSIRHSAADLGVHENTVRYRLARVNALTGLDVAGGASDQLSAQMALMVLRLREHPALPAFAEAA